MLDCTESPYPEIQAYKIIQHHDDIIEAYASAAVADPLRLR